jgi:hypothetical protein
MTVLSRAWLLIFALGLFVFTSCEKEVSEDGSDEQQAEASRVSSEADAEAENVFSGIFDDAYGANNDVGLEGSGVFWNRTDSLNPVLRCFTVTVVRLNPPAPFPVKVTIDFGNGCVGPDGRTRRGKIITVYTGRLIHPGSVAETTFDNFYIDSTKVEGVHRIENTSTPNNISLHIMRFKVDVTNGKLTRPNGNYIQWNSHKVIVQFDGMLTPLDPRDDAFRIEGNAQGTTRRGNLVVAWNSTITEPLVRRLSCRWIVRGRIRTVRMAASVANTWIAILDFGNGQCDRLATLTINGNTHIITLP